MGWCSGSELAQDVWEVVRGYIPADNRQHVARKIIDLFENRDCDTIQEAEQLCADAGLDCQEDYDDEPGNHER